MKQRTIGLGSAVEGFCLIFSAFRLTLLSRYCVLPHILGATRHAGTQRSQIKTALRFTLALPFMFWAQYTLSANISGLYNTGVDSSGNVLSDGSTDPHYAIISAPSPDSPGSAYVTIESGMPPTWVSDSSTAKWISPHADESGASGYVEPVGQFDYRMTFNLTDGQGNALDPNSATITGGFAADNGGNILLNGVQVGTVSGFSGYTSFTINTGFVSGKNTLDFMVVNTPGGDYEADPSGLTVNYLVGNASYPIQLTGYIYSSCNNAPIAGAQVQIGNDSSTSASDGSYSIIGISAGTYKATVNASNYIQFTDTITIPSGSNSLSQNFSLSPLPGLAVVDANPLFLGGYQLPQSITGALLEGLADSSATRTNAVADGITMLLLQFTNCASGTVIFTAGGASGGTLTAVDGSTLPTSGVHTITVNGEQVAFALYTVPDTIPLNPFVTFGSSFTPDGTSTFINQNPWTVKLIQTPVELVHGLWEDSSVWQSLQTLLNENSITNQALNYHWLNSAAGPFSAYQGMVNLDILSMLNLMRNKGIAVTRADVVAHSMGGILTRIDGNDPGAQLPENYHKGYIRRVITIDTPHFGSSAAPVLRLLANDSVWLNGLLNLSGHPVNAGAVQDLSPSSFASSLNGKNNPALKSMSFQSFAIGCYVASYTDFKSDPTMVNIYALSQTADLSLFGKSQNTLEQLLCGQSFTLFDTIMSMDEKIFFGQANDAIVSLPSQEGQCPSMQNYGDIDHLNAPKNLTILQNVLNLLQGSSDAFATPGFPAVTAADLDGQICNGGVPAANQEEAKPLGQTLSPQPQLQIPLITLVSPTNGATFLPGTNINILVQPLTNVILQQVSVLANGNNPNYNQAVAWNILTNAPYTNVIVAPTNFFGPMTIEAVGVDNNGNYDVEQCTVEILPGTNLVLESMSVNLNSIGTNLLFTELGVSKNIDVTGIYSDGFTRDISLAGAGTVYATANPSVAVVDTNGNVTAIANGLTFITVMNGSLSNEVPVQVSLQPPEIMSVQPDSLEAGTSNVNLAITGINLGGASSVAFLLNGQPDTNLVAGPLVIGGNAANIQVSVSIPASSPAETVTVVVTTPVGNSGEILTTGNQFTILPSPVRSFTNSYSFTTPFYDSVLGVSTNYGGFNPRAGLVLSGNKLYGTASQGGSAGNGAVFSVNSDGTDFTNIYSFSAGHGSIPNITNSDGACPVANLALSGNTLYGTTEFGGTAANGTIFKVNLNGTGFTNLHNFTASAAPAYTNSDGAGPQAGLTLLDDVLYGTAEFGGTFGDGTLFAVYTNGTGFTNLYSFTDGNDGAYPVAELTASGSMLYGTTYEGGSANYGTVFAVYTNGTSFTNLYSFTDGNDGGGPQAGLILLGNTLYGTASQGGSSDNGTVFAISTNGTNFTSLYNFAGYPSDGGEPVDALVSSGSTLYGTTEAGGSADDGTVFAISIAGTNYLMLHNFTGYPGDGATPAANLILSGNTLYGTAVAGGSFDNGTVFSLLPAATGQPPLAIASSGTNIIVTWSAAFNGFTLQSTTNLAPPVVWNIVVPAPEIINGQNTVTNGISGNQMYYRLSQ